MRHPRAPLRTGGVEVEVDVANAHGVRVSYPDGNSQRAALGMRRSLLEGQPVFPPASFCSQELLNRPPSAYVGQVDGSSLRKLAGRDNGSLWKSPGTASRAWSRGQLPGSGQGSATNEIDPPVLDDETKARQFRELALPYLDDAYNFARWLTRNSQDAQDVVQDAYMRAFQFFDGFRGANPRAWILTIVRNSYYAQIRKAQSQAEVQLPAASIDDVGNEQDVSEQEFPDPDQDDAETLLIKRTEADALHSFIAALPGAFREALVLREMEELSYQQIAEITGAPIGTVMSRLARARGLLQKAWVKYQEKEQSA
jgi:RNA polymerase sigma factor (sigma-70 family)